MAVPPVISSEEQSAEAQLTAGNELLIVTVRVDNMAAVRTDDLQAAEERAAAVFARIGVRIRWIDQREVIDQHLRPTFTLVLVNGDTTGGLASSFVEALGLANTGVRRAHVFYDRVAALHIGTPRTVPSLLGDVIAHELGHLFLPLPGHSLDGIMRPSVETHSWAVRTFTRAQARQIVSELRHGR